MTEHEHHTCDCENIGLFPVLTISILLLIMIGCNRLVMWITGCTKHRWEF